MSLCLDNVSFAYHGATPLLQKACLNIESGAFLLVKGASGTGKSTLLRLLCRLEEPTAGQILFEHTPLASIAPTRLRRAVAYVQQTPTLIHGSVRRNLLLPYQFAANKDLMAPDDTTLNRALEKLLLNDIDLDQDAAQLSVGQAQRLCLLRTLQLRPKVLLMDEPTSALDPDSTQVVFDAACKENEQGTTILLVTHAKAKPVRTTGMITIQNGTVEQA